MKNFLSFSKSKYEGAELKMEFRKIDKFNYGDCISLTVDDSQEGFVADWLLN